MENKIELSNVERKCIPHVAELLKKRKGADNAISNQQIRKELYKLGYKVSHGAIIRKLIEVIRRQDIVYLLCASKKGYFVANNAHEYETYLNALSKRIRSQQRVLHALMKQRQTVNFYK